MSSLRNLLVVSFFASIVFASPIKDDVAARANILCEIENPIIQALGAQQSATAFCSSYLAIPTQTLYATVTTTTSTSTTATITTGTEVDTAATLTLTEISSVTTTTVTLTTSDDTTPTAVVAERDFNPHAQPLALPPALSRFAAPILSSACSCLSIPKPSTTTTQTVTSTISSTSTTSTFAATTTYTPEASTTTTDTETATSTSVILKSDVLASIVAIVNDDSYQSFCSDILDYTTPVTTVYQTTTATASTTVVTTTSHTGFVTVTVTSVQGAPAKRQADSDPTPAPLASYPADYVTSGCLLAVTSPSTSTISSTVTETTTTTIVQTSTQNVQATSTATVTLVKYPVTNGNFETGSFAPWSIVQPISGTGGSWTLQPGDGATHGAWVAQLTMLNPDRTKYGSFGSWIDQTFPTYSGHSYTLTFDYQCVQISATSYINPQVPGSTSTQLTCASAGTWYQASLNFTATSTSSWVYLVATQNGYTQAVYQFDNVVVSLNQ